MMKLVLRAGWQGVMSLVIAAGISPAQSTVAPPASAPTAVSPGVAESVVEAEAVPDGVVESAVAAVGKLGLEAVQGKFQTALERMYPPWRSQSAARAGGEDRFVAAMAKVPAEMAKAGVSIVSCKPVGKPTVLEVSPGMRNVLREGETLRALGYTRWLVLVPTETVFRVIHQAPGQAPKRVLIESTGFQVAVSDKAKLDWTFMDGSSVTIRDLRGLFSTLPADLKLPPLGKREVR